MLIKIKISQLIKGYTTRYEIEFKLPVLRVVQTTHVPTYKQNINVNKVKQFFLSDIT